MTDPFLLIPKSPDTYTLFSFAGLFYSNTINNMLTQKYVT